MALIAAYTLVPRDYFAINIRAHLYTDFLKANPILHIVDLLYFSEKIEIDLQGRIRGRYH